MYGSHLRPRKDSKGNVSYQLVVEAERDPITGERKRYYKTFHGTKKQAQAELRKYTIQLETGLPTKASAMTVKQWLTTYIKDYLPNVSPTTKLGYSDILKNSIEPKLGTMLLSQLNLAIIQGWVNWLIQKDLSPKTIRNAFNLLNAAMNKAVLSKMILINPCTGVSLPKMRKPSMNYYTKKEVEHMMKCAENTDMYLPLLIATYLGLRRGELLALRWDNVDLKEGIVYVKENTVRAEKGTVTKEPKSMAGIRSISTGSKIQAALQQAYEKYLHDRDTIKGYKDSGLVICQPDGTAYQPDSMTQKWKRFIDRNDLRPIRFHDLRHTCTTMLIEAGVNPKEIQRRMGHSNITMTFDGYGHSTKTMSQEAADILDNNIANNIGDSDVNATTNP